MAAKTYYDKIFVLSQSFELRSQLYRSFLDLLFNVSDPVEVSGLKEIVNLKELY